MPEPTGTLTPEAIAQIDKLKNDPWDEPIKDDGKDPAFLTPDKETPKEGEEPTPKEPEETPKEPETPKEEAKTPEEIEAELVKKVMEEEALDEEKAKELVGSYKTLVDRHGSDPIKLAKALRKENQAYSLAQNKIKELEKFKTDVERQRLDIDEKRFEQNLEAQRDSIVEKYCKIHPDEADLSEDVIFERAKFKIKAALENEKAKKQSELKEQAETRKEELIASIPPEFEDVAPDVKRAIRELDAETVVSDTFNSIDSILYWARGKKYSPDYVKSLEDAAYKRGLEQPTIKNKRSVSSDSRAGGGGLNNKVSEKDRTRALEVYGNKDGWSEEQMLSEYLKNIKANDNWD